MLQRKEHADFKRVIVPCLLLTFTDTRSFLPCSRANCKFLAFREKTHCIFLLNRCPYIVFYMFSSSVLSLFFFFFSTQIFLSGCESLIIFPQMVRYEFASEKSNTTFSHPLFFFCTQPFTFLIRENSLLDDTLPS